MVDVGGTARFLDLPSRAHAFGYGISFNDGHAEIYVLRDEASRTWKPSRARPAGGINDWRALTNVTTLPIRLKAWTYLCATGAATAILLIGCSRKPTSQWSAPKSVDLGVVELSHNTPSHHNLGDKTVVVLTAAPMHASSIERFASLPVAIDRPLDISFGDVQIRLTPRIK